MYAHSGGPTGAHDNTWERNCYQDFGLITSINMWFDIFAIIGFVEALIRY
jgi:hypothetical protein